MGQTAINYGKVLLQLSVPREDIECSKQIWESSDRLRQALCSPIIKQEEKYRVLQQIFPKSMHPFLLTVCKYHKCELLSDMFQAYQSCYEKENGIASGVLYYIEEPEKAQLTAIEKGLCEKLSVKKVQLTLCKKTELIGGFQIRIGDLEIDESILGRLKLLEQRLIRR